MSNRTRSLFSDAWPVMVVALSLAACKGGGTPLIEMRALEAGEECAAGGSVITVGVDADGDGRLSGDEITGSETVCNGADGAEGQHGTLTTTTVLAVGDPDCPYGGLRLDAGRDDGTGGGTAGDGLLQPGEITSTELVCNGRSAVTYNDMEPPAGPAGAYAADVSGGPGSAVRGGDGGVFELEFYEGPGGGGIKVFTTGEAQSPVAFPSVLSAYLGPNPAIVTTSTTVKLDPDTATLADGELYMASQDDRLFRWDDANDEGLVVTGLRVASGATLTLPNNIGQITRAALALSNDLHLAGTLTTTDGSGGKVHLTAQVATWVGEATGRVDLSGGPGVSGHDALIVASDCREGPTQCGGAVFNRATFDVSGGDASGGGGDGGDVYLEGEVATYNLGSIDASGGVATAGAGGVGGFIGFDVQLGTVFNGGALDLRGGAGQVQGGYGGEAYFYSGSSGFVVNTGDVDARGGAAQTCSGATACYGGQGGGLYAYLYSSAFVNTGDIDGRGGDAPLPASPTTESSFGGGGGYVYVYYDNYGNGWWGQYVLPGDVHFSGDLRLGGGAGGQGGTGGRVDVYHYPYYTTNNQEIVFYGYPSIDASGGDGPAGGDGGSVTLETNYGEDLTGGYAPGGFVVNAADVDARGGAATAFEGGDGGAYSMRTDYYYFTDWSVAVNTGEVDLRGGSSAGGDGGYGGEALLWGIAGVTNSGTIDTSGGDGSGDGWGAGAGELHLLSDQGPVTNTADLTANGGDSDARMGGQGYTIELVGATVHNAGALRANGGDSPMTDAWNGGSGGSLFLHSLWGTTEQTSSTLEVSAGAGDEPGEHGQVFIDGMNVTDDWTP